VRVDGPNGFMREFSRDGSSSAGEDALLIGADHANGTPASGVIELSIINRGAGDTVVTVRDESYAAPPREMHVDAGERATVAVSTESSGGWYDVTVSAGALAYRYAGRVETGRPSITDPAMGAARP
jgi:phospholipase C